MKVTLLLSLFISTSITSFPGDQDSLSCVDSNYAYRTKYINQYRNRDATNANWLCTQSDPAQKEACIEKNKADAIADVTKAVRSNYDTSKHFTKMGDSLSDFVDLYGVVDPRKVYGVPIGDVAGYYDGLPFYMDKWDDYLSIGAGLPAGYRQGYQVSNYAKYGFTTKDVMKTLGINLNEDADCTDVSCGFVWSCSDTKEVIHFDAVVNDSLFSLETGNPFSKSFRLSNVLLKQLGAVAGLYHCPAGDGNCSAGDPVPGSALFKFLVPENYNISISQDDKNGMQSLYGGLNDNEKKMLATRQDFLNKAAVFCSSPCLSPEEETGKYQVTAEETFAWNDYIQDRTEAGLETYEQKLSLYKDFENSYQRSFRVSGISAETYMIDSMTYETSYLAQMPSIMINYYLQNLYVDIKNRSRCLKEYKDSLDPSFAEFTENELKVLTQIRRNMIDEKLKR